MKKILLIGTPTPDRLEAYYATAFRRLGIELTIFDPAAVLRPLLRGRIRYRLTLPFHHQIVHRALLRLYRSPTWDAVFVVKGYSLSADTIHACKTQAPSIPWAVLNPDSPFETDRGTSSSHIRESIGLFDLYFIWSRELVGRLAEAGSARPRYLAFAYDEDNHYPAAAGDLDSSLSSTITFVGTYDRHRAEVLESISNLPVRVFGENWERLPAKSPIRNRVVPGLVRAAQMRQIVTSSLVCLNILRPQNYGAHNMRTFEVPSMRGLMLTRRSPEQQQYFPELESSLMYESDGELRSQLASVLAGEHDLERMRERGRELSSEHTYLARAREVYAELAALCA